MSAYITTADTDYVAAGVVLTPALILQASAAIDAYCGRSIEVKSYTERIRLSDAFPHRSSYPAGHVTYAPVVEIVSAKGRPKINAITGIFFGAPGFEDIPDLSIVDMDRRIGSFQMSSNPFGVPYAEIEITYRSGWETIPEEVKVACDMMINQIVSRPNADVKSKKDFDFSVEYFSSGRMTPDIASLLSDYVLHRFR